MNAYQRITERVKLLGQYALNLLPFAAASILLCPSVLGGLLPCGWHQQVPLMLEWRQEKGGGLKNGIGVCILLTSSPWTLFLRLPVWLQATAPGSQPSPEHSNSSLLLRQAYLAHASPLVLHFSCDFLTLWPSSQMCPLLEYCKLFQSVWHQLPNWASELPAAAAGKDGCCIARDGC